MSVFKTCALAAAAVLVAASTYAAPAQATKTTKATAAKATAAPKPKAHSVVGTLDKYDSGANTIVVNTGKGTETLSLSSSSAVRMGAKTMTAADLTIFNSTDQPLLSVWNLTNHTNQPFQVDQLATGVAIFTADQRLTF